MIESRLDQSGVSGSTIFAERWIVDNSIDHTRIDEINRMAPLVQQEAGYRVSVWRMIRDIERLGTTGRVRRLVAELGVPVRQWRDALQVAARNRGWRIQTLLVVTVDPASGQPTQEVRAERTDRLMGSRGRLVDVGQDSPPPASVVHLMPQAGPSDVATERARRAGHPCTWD